MTIRIRAAVPDDLDAVRCIGAWTWPPTYLADKGPRYVMAVLDGYWSAEALRPAIEAGRIDVAEAAQGVVGMVEVDELGADLVMWKLYVVPPQQGTGIGHALVESAKDRARTRGCDLITEHEPENAPAAGFYARAGFAPTEAPWPGTDAVWLRWRDDAASREQPATDAG